MKAAVVGLAAWVVLSSVHASTVDRSAQAATGEISGRVMMVTGNAPPQAARRAIVTLSGDTLSAPRSVISRDDGTFVIDRLPAGRFMLSATKPAYLLGAYGALRPGRRGVPIALAAGERKADVNVTLTRGGAISGTVRDGSGAPIPSPYVFAYRLLPDGSAISEGYVAADDRGAYRIYTLPAGDYLVVAELSNQYTGVAPRYDTDVVDRKLAALRTRQPVAAGTPASTPSPAPTAGSSSTVSTTYYPSAISPDDAVRVPVTPGEDRTGIDIVLDRTHSTVVTITLSGVAPNDSLTPTMRLSSTMPNPRGGPNLTGRRGGPGPYRFTHVTPGRYTILVQPEMGTRSSQFAMAELTVSGEDELSVALALQPVLALKGTLVFDGATPPPSDLTAIRVLLDDVSPTARAAGSRGGGAGPTLPVTTDARGRFSVDLVPGLYRARTLPSAPSGWVIRSAIIDGKDALDAPVAIGLVSNLDGAVITFTDKHTELSGALEVASGSAIPSDYYIVVFPENRAQWVRNARRIRSVRPGTDGTYSIRDLPPGTYRLAALTDVAPDDLIDPAFFDALLPASIAVTLGEGEARTQSLRVGGR